MGKDLGIVLNLFSSWGKGHHLWKLEEEEPGNMAAPHQLVCIPYAHIKCYEVLLPCCHPEMGLGYGGLGYGGCGRCPDNCRRREKGLQWGNSTQSMEIFFLSEQWRVEKLSWLGCSSDRHSSNAYCVLELTLLGTQPHLHGPWSNTGTRLTFFKVPGGTEVVSQLPRWHHVLLHCHFSCKRKENSLWSPEFIRLASVFYTEVQNNSQGGTSVFSAKLNYQTSPFSVLLFGAWEKSLSHFLWFIF